MLDKAASTRAVFSVMMTLQFQETIALQSQVYVAVSRISEDGDTESSEILLKNLKALNVLKTFITSKCSQFGIFLNDGNATISETSVAISGEKLPMQP